MTTQNVYLDTSFFMAVLEDQQGRKSEALRIVDYERNSGTNLFTSILTINEFTILTYNLHRNSDDVEERVSGIIGEIRKIAPPYGINEGIMRRAALVESAWRARYGTQDPGDPRRRKLRWDSIHLATANELSAVRVYAWDGKWDDVPRETIPNVGLIIAPAKCPQGYLVDITSPNAPEPPDEQSPSAPSESEP